MNDETTQIQGHSVHKQYSLTVATISVSQYLLKDIKSADIPFQLSFRMYH
jgi:hypothetical protein